MKETPKKRKQNLVEALDAVEGDGDEEDEAEDDETTTSRVKKESNRNLQGSSAKLVRKTNLCDSFLPL